MKQPGHHGEPSDGGAQKPGKARARPQDVPRSQAQGHGVERQKNTDGRQGRQGEAGRKQDIARERKQGRQTSHNHHKEELFPTGFAELKQLCARGAGRVRELFLVHKGVLQRHGEQHAQQSGQSREQTQQPGVGPRHRQAACLIEVENAGYGEGHAGRHQTAYAGARLRRVDFVDIGRSGRTEHPEQAARKHHRKNDGPREGTQFQGDVQAAHQQEKR